MMPTVVEARKSWAPVLSDDAREGEQPRFVWLGIRMELSDGVRVFWHKSGSVSVTMPESVTRYRSGRETGEMRQGEKCSQSAGEFVRTHSPAFVGLVLGTVQEVLLESA